MSFRCSATTPTLLNHVSVCAFDIQKVEHFLCVCTVPPSNMLTLDNARSLSQIHFQHFIALDVKNNVAKKQDKTISLSLTLSLSVSHSRSLFLPVKHFHIKRILLYLLVSLKEAFLMIVHVLLPSLFEFLTLFPSAFLPCRLVFVVRSLHNGQ